MEKCFNFSHYLSSFKNFTNRLVTLEEIYIFIILITVLINYYLLLGILTCIFLARAARFLLRIVEIK